MSTRLIAAKLFVLVTAFLTSNLPAAEFSCPESGIDRVPEIGEKLGSLPPSDQVLVVNSATIAPCYSVTAKGISFDFAVSRSDNAVIYIATDSASFETPEGVTLTTSLSKLSVRYPDSTHWERGWGSFLELPSGWSAYISLEETLDGQGTISLFFKRK